MVVSKRPLEVGLESGLLEPTPNGGMPCFLNLMGQVFFTPHGSPNTLEKVDKGWVGVGEARRSGRRDQWENCDENVK